MMMTRIVVGKRRAHDCPPVAVAFHTMFRMIFAGMTTLWTAAGYRLLFPFGTACLL